MDNRFDKQIEAGGEKAQEKPARTSWKEKLSDKFKTPKTNEHDDGNTPVEREVSVVDFIRGIVTDKQPPRSEEKTSWIDRAFEEKAVADHVRAEAHLQIIEAMDDNLRTEFLMVVAQRFKDAGERFISVVNRLQRDQVSVDELRREVLEAVEPLTEEDPQDHEVGEHGSVVAPPFEFAMNRAREDVLPAALQTDSNTEGAAQVVPVEFLPNASNYDYSPVNREVIKDGEVTTVIYKPRLRDALLGGALGGYGASRTEIRKSERKIIKKMRKEKQAQKAEIKKQNSAQNRLEEALRVQHIRMSEIGEKTAQTFDFAPQKPKFDAISPQKIIETTNSGRSFEKPQNRSAKREVEELEFAKLRSATDKHTQTYPEKIAKPIPEVAPFGSEVYTERPEIYRQDTSSASSIKEILQEQTRVAAAERAKDTKASREGQPAKHGDTRSQDTVNNWISTVVIVVLVAICVLFITAV